jgi:RsiW-degrading membrane proteinase PrsW (M82 family)
MASVLMLIPVGILVALGILFLVWIFSANPSLGGSDVMLLALLFGGPASAGAWATAALTAGFVERTSDGAISSEVVVSGCALGMVSALFLAQAWDSSLPFALAPPVGALVAAYLPWTPGAPVLAGVIVTHPGESR